MVRKKFWKEVGPYDLLGVGFPFYKSVLVSHFYKNRKTRARMKIYKRRRDKRAARNASEER